DAADPKLLDLVS
ncbi:unnamed protein product, partial [Rotaria sp. Silwood1]